MYSSDDIRLGPERDRERLNPLATMYLYPQRDTLQGYSSGHKDVSIALKVEGRRSTRMQLKWDRSCQSEMREGERGRRDVESTELLYHFPGYSSERFLVGIETVSMSGDMEKTMLGIELLSIELPLD